MCCNVPVRNFQRSNTLTILHTGASYMMDGGAANFGATRYPGRYSNCTLDDKLFNLMWELNNAVLGIWIEQCCSCSWNLRFKRPDLNMWKNVGMGYFNVPFLDLPWLKEEQLPVCWHIWSTQHQIMLHFNCHSCPTFMTFHEFIALVLNCVKVLDLCNTNESSIHTN